MENVMANILIVDDHDYVRSSIRTTLEKENHSITEADDGSTAIEEIKKKDIDLIIMDIVMSNKGGIETLMDLRKEQHIPEVIMITGQVKTDSLAFHNLIAQFGARHLLYKPFRKDELLNVVHEVLKI